MKDKSARSLKTGENIVADKEELKLNDEEKKIIEIYRLEHFNFGNMIVYKREGKLSGAIEVHSTHK